MGGGLDMRAHLFAKSGVTFFEVDQKAVLEYRRAMLIIWEGNTMYLPPELILPFLNRLADRIASFRVGFDYFAVDMRTRDFETNEDRARLERVEKAMGAPFPAGFPNLAVFEETTPLKVAESGSFADLGEQFGAGETLAAYPEDYLATLDLYRYCVLATG